MPKLTESDKLARLAFKKAQREQQVKSLWYERESLALTACEEAGARLEQLRSSAAISLRELWLVLAVFEIDRKSYASGKSESCKTKWLDRIAPRAKEGHGVQGFTTRTAAKFPEFLKPSRNGYIWLTPQGDALALYVLQKYPELNASDVNPWRPVELPDLGTFPPLRWRGWKE